MVFAIVTLTPSKMNIFWTSTMFQIAFLMFTAKQNSILKNVPQFSLYTEIRLWRKWNMGANNGTLCKSRFHGNRFLLIYFMWACYGHWERWNDIWWVFLAISGNIKPVSSTCESSLQAPESSLIPWVRFTNTKSGSSQKNLHSGRISVM